MSELESFVDKLQNKSEKSRKKILWVSTSSIFGIVLFVWITTLGMTFTQEYDGEIQEKVSPFASVGHIFTIIKEDILSGVGVVTKQAQEVSSEVRGNAEEESL